MSASGCATPATYEINGRQFVVIAAAGHSWGGGGSTTVGGAYVAFARPKWPIVSSRDPKGIHSE
jgi:quinoprotein glucose dehydrogenase